jgi:hypothetical protein
MRVFRAARRSVARSLYALIRRAAPVAYAQDGLISVHSHAFMQDPAFIKARQQGVPQQRLHGIGIPVASSPPRPVGNDRGARSRLQSTPGRRSVARRQRLGSPLHPSVGRVSSWTAGPVAASISGLLTPLVDLRDAARNFRIADADKSCHFVTFEIGMRRQTLTRLS